jgi:hypothetical protein
VSGTFSFFCSSPGGKWCQEPFFWGGKWFLTPFLPITISPHFSSFEKELFPMLSKTSSFWVLALVALITLSAGKVRPSQKGEGASVLLSTVDEHTLVRFFHQPPLGDYFHFPLVFRVVEESNPLLNTAPMREEGRTAYISLSEMRELMQRLAQMDLAWKESDVAEPLGPFKKLALAGIGINNMEVFIGCSKGTARTTIAPKKICETLTPLDSALKAPRALWEFQLFRLDYGCKVPGFRTDAYPDHI